MRPGLALLPLLLLLPTPEPAAEPAARLFEDVTTAAGIPALRYGEGVNMVDLDGDGYPELFLPCVRGRDRLFRNRGDGRFTEVTEPWGLTEGGGIGAVVADLDRNGSPELLVVRGAYPYGRNLLFTRGAGGRLAEVAAGAGLAARKNGIAAAVADFDGDGAPDVFVANWGGDTLYRNRAEGGLAFSDVTGTAGLPAEGRSWGALFADFTGDGRPDLFVARGGRGKPEASRLAVNRGDGTFVDRTDATDLARTAWSMGAVPLDCDGDGDQDLLVTGYEGPDRLFRNLGGGVLRDETAASGIASSRGVGAAAGFVDGDLQPDLVVAAFDGPVRFYRGLGGCRFRDETAAAGFQSHPRNEGVALGDVDGDGDLDCYVTNYDGFNRLYQNTLDAPRYVKVRLPADTPGLFGTVARLSRPGGDAAPLATQELLSGYGFCSQGPMEFLFRLPDEGPWELSLARGGSEFRSFRAWKPGSVLAP
jgi:hypothetical protein